MPKTAAVEEAEEKIVDLTAYVTKAPTPLQAREPDWIMENTEYDPASAKTKEEAFRMGVKLCLNVHKFFQVSDENRAATAEAREAKELERAEREELKAAKAEEREAAEAEREEKRQEREAKKAEREAAQAAKAADKPAKAPAKTIAKAPAKTVAKAPVKAVKRPIKKAASGAALF